MEACDISFDELRVGDTATISRTWSEDDVMVFAQLSGDENPLHMDAVYADTTQFKNRLVHGMLVGSLCSTLVGMHIPGKRCLYLTQSLSFKKPVFIGDTTEATVLVTAKSESTRVLGLSLTITCRDSVVIEGEAQVAVL